MQRVNAVSAQAAGTIGIGGDLTVNRMGFGAMRLTGSGIWGEHPDPEACKAVLRRVIELDINFIDTADSYGPEVSERLIAETLYPYPDDLVIATKAGMLRPGPGQWVPNGRPDHIKKACEGSLRRLRLEEIPLYQFHRPDPKVPIEESVGAMSELKEQGKVRHIGVSNVDEEQLARARTVTPIVSVQNRYNLGDRDSDGLIDVCEDERLAFLPWRPVADLAEAQGPLAEVAQRHDATPAQGALAWLLRRSPATLLIPGTASIQHLEANVGAAAIELDDDDLRTLEEVKTES